MATTMTSSGNSEDSNDTTLAWALSDVTRHLASMGFTHCQIKVKTLHGPYRDLVTAIHNSRDFEHVRVTHDHGWHTVTGTAIFESVKK